MSKKKRLLKRLLLWILILPLLLAGLLISVLYLKQEAIVQELISVANEDFKGTIRISGSHISPFANFPYISIDLDELKLYESKDTSAVPVLDIKDIYLGFDLLTILSGKTQIKSIKLRNGTLRVIQSAAGEFNLLKALETTHPVENAGDEFHLDLQSVYLENIDLVKVNEGNGMTVEAFVTRARSKFRTSPGHLMINLESKFVLNVIKDQDTTFFKHKRIDFDTRLDYDEQQKKLSITSSTLALEQVLFSFEGNAGFSDGLDLDLAIRGNKPNFDLFMAFAPEELMPVLKKYDNKGRIYFDASIKGKVTAGKMPRVLVNFGCEDAFLQNSETRKRLDDLNFKAYFTNGDSANLSTMQFSLLDFSSRPEAGVFSGHLIVRNFESPEIDTRIVSDFDLDFLSKFLEIKNLQDLRGKVRLTMNFKDVIDLRHPEKAIEKLNESYFTQLHVTGLGFRSKAFHLPVEDVNIVATMSGHEARIKQFDIRVGRSDLSLNGSISDLPAIIHHTKDPVSCVLNISSRLLDIKELSSGNLKKRKPLDEQIEDLSMKLSFKSTARAFTESPNLPVGEFFIDKLYARPKHYPHTLHDFHADLLIDSTDFRIIDFTGMIDKSDFHFSGRLKNYHLWFADTARGDTRIDFNLRSRLLRLEDLFSYKGKNYVPEDYRHEEFRQFRLQGYTLLHFNKKLVSADLYLDRLNALMKIHHYKFERFKGRVHIENEHLSVHDFSGKLGKSEFNIDLNYYLGKDQSIKKRNNHFGIRAKYLDFDELFAFKPASATSTPTDHEKGFNIYELPFTDMTFDLDIAHLNYHRYLIHDLKGQLRTTPEHYLHIEALSLRAADGRISLKGYFNGSDKDRIYFRPDLRFEKIDLDKLLLKFENFGQDHIVSENIHGQLTGTVTGQLRMHRDMVPVIDESELHMDLQITEGRLEKYAPLSALSDYFKDKNLAKVLFDTLQNHIDIHQGEIAFPNMTINSSLGFLEVSGKQNMKSSEMEYYVRVPLKLVSGVARQKLFGSGRSEEADPDQEDEIQYKDHNKKTRYINLKLSGNAQGYKVSLAKDKSISNTKK
jgi:hypothetical protein